MSRGLRVLLLVAAVVVAVACGVPDAPSGGAGSPAIRVEPSGTVERAPRVVRIRVTGVPVAPGAFALFEGELGDYHEGRLRRGELPSTLAERRIPATAWVDGATDEIVVAPERRLEAGQGYGLGALGWGGIVTIIVVEDEQPFAERVWPPLPAAGGGRLVFCTDGPPVAPDALVFGPSGFEAIAASGADSLGTSADRCVRVDLPSGALGVRAVPPPSISGVSLDPTPIVVDVTAREIAGVACSPSEVPMGPGCGEPFDDRIVVRSPDEPLFWTASVAGDEFVFGLAPSARGVFAGLAPDRAVSVSGAVTDLAGRETRFDASAHTLPAAPHVVLNEVLANPLGAEPRQEWVEIVNVGPEAVSLAGFTIEDGGGRVDLPPAVVPAGAFALLVGSDYDAAAPEDVPAVEGTLLVRLARLGSSGLSNGGEALTLRSPTGLVVSRFPAVPATRAGVSIERASPGAFDDDRGAFRPCGASGASPGGRNGAAAP